MDYSWIHNGFCNEEMCGPFLVENDLDYYKNLKCKYDLVINQAKIAGADKESLSIIRRFKKKILEALRSYYKADTAKCNTIIKNLIIDVGVNTFAVDDLKKSCAFGGDGENEIQFFRGRKENQSNIYKVKDMLHLPQKLRAKSGNYRFSIPGNPSLYLSNSSYGCWIELGMPADNEFNVSPVLLDGSQKVLNLVVSFQDNIEEYSGFDEEQFHCWIKLCLLSMATSYRVAEAGRTFKSEYIISQAVMMACKKLNYDGVAYCSKRVSSGKLALAAINLALFVNYSGEYSDIVSHMKMDAPYNYGMYKQLLQSLNYKEYNLHVVSTGYITNIGSNGRQYPYRETKFYEFDQFLFTSWSDKLGDDQKDKISWGIFAD